MRDDVRRCCRVYSSVSHKQSFFSFSVGYDFVGLFVMWMIIFLLGKGVGLLMPNNLCTLKNTNPRCACASRMPMVKTAAFSRATFVLEKDLWKLLTFLLLVLLWSVFVWLLSQTRILLYYSAKHTNRLHSISVGFFFFFWPNSVANHVNSQAKWDITSDVFHCGKHNDLLQLLVFYALSKTKCPLLSGLCNNILQYMKKSLWWWISVSFSKVTWAQLLYLML